MPRTAENSDHQNPGALRMRSVLIKPTMPLNNTTQPTMIFNRDCGHGRKQQRDHPQDDENDSLAQKKSPMLMQRRGHRRLDFFEVFLVDRHGRNSRERCAAASADT